MECIQSLVFLDTFNEKDTIVQMCRCSFDIHVQEIFGALISGSALVMLSEQGTLDLDYLVKTVYTKQITYMHTVPSLLYSLFTFVEQCGHFGCVRHLRSICSSGMLLNNNV